MNTNTQKQLQSWVEVPENSDFPIQNLPYGIFKTAKRNASVGVAIGTKILMLKEVARLGFFDELCIDTSVFSEATLNRFIALGKKNWNAVRNIITTLLDAENTALYNFRNQVLIEMADAQMLLPVQIGDYTDFYSSLEHATNVGTMFRGKENALMPNWKHLPVGYHGRASSVVISGTDIHRPKGQTLTIGAENPELGPSTRMDFELEMAFIIGKETHLGETVSTENAEEHIFGMLLFNDWSARDIQKWEYVPLGPFLGKNFASSVSPWLVTMEALEPFRVESPTQMPAPLPYLQYEGKKSYDIHLSVGIAPEGAEESTVCQSNFKYMYWTMVQQLAHHTVNGCNIKVGDLMASGTLSGPTPDSFASMLELSWAGQKEVVLANGATRKFLHDGDTVVMKAYCQKEGLRIGFGEVRSKLLPAR